MTRYGPTLKKEKNVTNSDPEDCGDVYTLTAIKTDTRLFICHHEGDRSTEAAISLFKDVERRRSIRSPIPVFTSDNWDPFEEGLVNVYGYLETPHYNGIGRKPLPILIPYPSLKYAQVCKQREKGRVVEVIQRVVFGNPDELMKALGVDSGGKINTAYIERLNLTQLIGKVRAQRHELQQRPPDTFSCYRFLPGLVQLRQTTPISEKREQCGKKKMDAANSSYGRRSN